MSSFIFITDLCGLHLPACSFLSELNEAAVFLTAFKQFLMCTAADPSPVKHHDLIGIPYRLEPVRDHDHCLVFRQGIESSNQFIFIFRIHVGRRLVQDNDRGILQDRSGNGYPLLFTAGKRCSAVIRFPPVYDSNSVVRLPPLL